MEKTEKLKYCKYYNSANRKGGNYYERGVFNQQKSIAVEAEGEWLNGSASSAVLSDFRKQGFNIDDAIPEELKALLYAVWSSVNGKGKNEFLDFYKSIYK